MARTIVVTGSAARIRHTTAGLLTTAAHRVIGVDRHQAEVSAGRCQDSGGRLVVREQMIR